MHLRHFNTKSLISYEIGKNVLALYKYGIYPIIRKLIQTHSFKYIIFHLKNNKN